MPMFSPVKDGVDKLSDKTYKEIEKSRSGIFSDSNAMLIISVCKDTAKTLLKLLCSCGIIV